MRTFIKIVVFLIVIVIAGLIALPFFIDPNDYKDEISREVEKVTGRNLTLQGDIGLSVFPWIALAMQRVLKQIHLLKFRPQKFVSSLFRY